LQLIYHHHHGQPVQPVCLSAETKKHKQKPSSSPSPPPIPVILSQWVRKEIQTKTVIIITASHFSHFDSVPKQINRNKNHHHHHHHHRQPFQPF